MSVEEVGVILLHSKRQVEDIVQHTDEPESNNADP
jgi:hypothetical protein